MHKPRQLDVSVYKQTYSYICYSVIQPLIHSFFHSAKQTRQSTCMLWKKIHTITCCFAQLYVCLCFYFVFFCCSCFLGQSLLSFTSYHTSTHFNKSFSLLLPGLKASFCSTIRDYVAHRNKVDKIFFKE